MTDEKLCPAIILTPSSPLDQTDYQILVIPTQQPRSGRLAWLRPWRAQRAAIQLPMSADVPSFPVGVIPVDADKRRRRRMLLLFSIPLILLIMHILLAMMHYSAYHADPMSSGSVWEPLAGLFGFGPAHHLHEEAQLAAAGEVLVPLAEPSLQ
jgi:hypothetical protein